MNDKKHLTVRDRSFHRKAPEKDIPVLNISILGLGKLDSCILFNNACGNNFACMMLPTVQL